MLSQLQFSQRVKPSLKVWNNKFVKEPDYRLQFGGITYN